MRIHLAGCVIIKDESILLLHRIKTDWYELPGGKVDEGEDDVTAAIRELKEELGVDVKILKKLGQKDFTENEKILQYAWYLAEISNDQMPSICEPDTFDKFSYVSLNELKTHTLSPNMMNLLSEIEKGAISI
jgi:8-oxo-dGTP pyrophosphatase MutT (NUDIX family)